MITLKFETHYVAFLDVLGFKEIINNDNKEKLQTYFKTAHDAVQRVQNDKEKLKVFLISDSIIIIAENNIDQLKLMLRAIQTLQIELINKNIWLRGAVTIGAVDFDQSTNMIVGKALTKAYLLEQEAILPRVIIDPKILKELKVNKAEFISKLNGNHSFEESNDNKLIHDTYIKISEESIFVSFANRLLYEHFYSKKHSLTNIFKDLVNNLYSEQKHYTKYLWIKNYFINSLMEYEASLIEEKSQFNTGYGLEVVKKWIEKFNCA